MATIISGVQYSGIWNISSQANAKAAGTWPSQPLPGQGALYSWGYNAIGQLGLNNRTSYSSPKQVGSLTTWVSLAGGSSYSLAVISDGTLWSWGSNSNGELGLGNRTSYSSPKQVGSLTNWSSVSSNSNSLNSLAIKTDGTLWGWGLNGNGALGFGNTNYYSSPKQVGSLTTWSQVSSGYSYTTAVKTDGTLWSWGYNAYGQLGIGNTTRYSSPKQVGALTNWLRVTAGYYSTYAIKTNGTLWAWGNDGFGQLGLGNSTGSNYSSPKQVGLLTDWSSIVTGQYSALAVKTDGTLWAWGNGNNGDLGLGTTVATYYSSPKQVGALTNWSKLAANSSSFTLGLKTNGTLWGWGQGGNGRLGLGNTTNYSSPKQIGTETNWTNVAASNSFSFGNRI